jgi:hypothetical protein
MGKKVLDKLKIKVKEEDEDKEEEVEEFDTEELQMRLDAMTTLMKDIDVSTIVKSYKSLIPLDSHKIDYGRVPSSLADYIERSIELQLIIEQMLTPSDETIRFLESYNILTKLRIYSAVEGWLLRMILGSRGGGR